MTGPNSPCLLVVDGPETGGTLVLDAVLKKYVIGSEEGCALRLGGIARRHATVFVDDAGFVTIEDARSGAGLWVNGERTSAATLEDGDEVSLGAPGRPGSRLLRLAPPTTDSPAADPIEDSAEEGPPEGAIEAPADPSHRPKKASTAGMADFGETMGSSEEARAEALKLAAAAGRAQEADARRAAASKTPPRSPVALRIAIVAVVAAIAATYGIRAYRASIAGPIINTYQPDPIEPGKNLSITGFTFPEDAAKTIVRFGGVETTASTAEPDRINVTVPEALGAKGSRLVTMTVVSEGKASLDRLVRIDASPRIDAVTPQVAWTGDEIEVRGRWLRSESAGPDLTVAGVTAEVLSATPTLVRAKVPVVDALEGRTLPVRATVGAEGSREAGMIFGRLPFVASVEPARVESGDEIRLSGAGLDAPGLSVEIGGREALVIENSAQRLVAIVPGLGVSEPGGPRSVRVRSSERASLPREVDVRRESSASYVPRFFAERAGAEPPRARVAMEAAPLFALRSESIADLRRAHAAALVLNRLAKTAQRARVVFEARDTTIVSGGDLVLTVAPGDGSGDPRAAAALWAATLSDVFDLFFLNRRGTRAVEISADGQVFLDLYAVARRRGGAGISTGVLTGVDPGWTRAFEALAAGAASRPRPEKALDGVWSGALQVEGRPVQNLEFSFSASGDGLSGTRSARGGRVSTSLSKLSYVRRDLRFSFVEGGAEWSFRGTLDGDAIDGEVRPAGGRPVKLALKLVRS